MRIVATPPSGGKKPTTPTIGTATDGGTGTTVSVAFTPSTYIGKGTITYTATSSPGSLTGTGSGSPITVSGLTTGTAYTFTVAGATNYGVNSDSSAASNSVTPASPSSFESIATINGTGSSKTLTFSSIPNTYKSLQIRMMVNETAGGAGTLRLRFNGDTGTNYAQHYINATGSAVAAFGNANTNMIALNTYLNWSNTMKVSIIDIIDYASTSKNKTLRGFDGFDTNGANSQEVNLYSGLWNSTAAVTSITIYGDDNNFSSASTFALYGIK